MPRKGYKDTMVRKQVSIDPDDAALLRWWGAQKKPSASIRDLVYAAIERDGYTDSHFREVEQRPRVGRPPAQSQPNHTDEERSSASEEYAVSPLLVPPSVLPSAPLSVPASSPVPQSQPQAVSRPRKERRAPEVARVPDQATQPSQATQPVAPETPASSDLDFFGDQVAELHVSASDFDDIMNS